MANIENMTSAELQQLAAAKAQDESRATSVIDYYEDVKPVEPYKPQPWEQPVEFEGSTYYVDVRRTKSREFARLLATARTAQTTGELEDNPAIVMDVMDFLFRGSVDDAVVANVTARLGYDDFEEIYRIESALIDQLDVKN